MPVPSSLKLDRARLSEFCRRWKVRELSVFGSALRDDFREDSDIDLLIAFDPDANWGLFDQAVMEAELGSILDRRVDLVSRRAIERSPNWIRRQAILESAERLHVA